MESGKHGLIVGISAFDPEALGHEDGNWSSSHLRWRDHSNDDGASCFTLHTLAETRSLMLRWFHALMPKEDRFLDLFAEHASAIVNGAVALRAMLEGGDAIAENYQLVMARENDADNVTREVLIAVHRSFITPFDRGNIRDLITSMDNSIDQMQKTAKSIRLFNITKFTPQMKQMGDAIVKCANLVQEGLPLLRSISSQAARISSITEQISALEGRADEMHDVGLHELYQTAATGGNALTFFVGNEVYDHLEKVVDRFDDVANVMHGIVIEHV